MFSKYPDGPRFLCRVVVSCSAYEACMRIKKKLPRDKCVGIWDIYFPRETLKAG